VRLATPEGTPDLTVVLEVKGFERNEEAAKHDAAGRWVRAGLLLPVVIVAARERLA
jgi:hypothetical protein